MKLSTLLFTVLAAFTTSTMLGQMNDKEERKSPPAEVTKKVGDATITINYSQPSMNDREIYGGLVPYGKVWRTGANEATTFETDRALMINGKKLPAGKYALFTIPGEKEWTIIFNSNSKQWGAYDYKAEDDVLRVKAKPVENDTTEKMTFIFTDDGVINLDWANTRVPFTVKS
ncbi:MAG: DUF2911 domain-containing protein [Owenweeksia sp.]|nr:DUF2911 domain-containing protein [Owenweeksia sp.]